MRLTACLVLISLVISSTVVGARQAPSDAPIIDETYSFENDFEGWTVNGTHINPDLPSPVTRSQEMAKDGVYSLRFDVNRDEFFQFIWIEKVFDVDPNQIYDFEIDYALGTRDCCSNAFVNLAGALTRSPETLEDLTSLGQDFPDNGETLGCSLDVDKLRYTSPRRR